MAARLSALRAGRALLRRSITFLLLVLYYSTITEAATGLLYQPQMVMDDDEYGSIGGMLGRGNRSIRKKSTPVPLCEPQIPHDLTRARTRAIAVGSRPKPIQYVECLHLTLILSIRLRIFRQF
jgi:hypothetical protein